MCLQLFSGFTRNHAEGTPLQCVYVCVQVKTNIGDLQFLYCDLVLTTLLAIVMGGGGPGKELHPCRPSASLLALPVLGSLLIHASFIVLGQLAAFFITTSQDWSVYENKR